MNDPIDAGPLHFFPVNAIVFPCEGTGVGTYDRARFDTAENACPACRVWCDRHPTAEAIADVRAALPEGETCTDAEASAFLSARGADLSGDAAPPIDTPRDFAERFALGGDHVERWERACRERDAQILAWLDAEAKDAEARALAPEVLGSGIAWQMGRAALARQLAAMLRGAK